jgi:hypothetical protein
MGENFPGGGRHREDRLGVAFIGASTRVWVRGRTTGGATGRRGEHPRLPAKKGGDHGWAPSSRLAVRPRVHRWGGERGTVLPRLTCGPQAAVRERRGKGWADLDCGEG